MTANGLTRGERLQIMLSPEELSAIDDFRFKQRMPSRAAAVRDLLRLGLGAVGIEPASGGMKSNTFGVLERGDGDATNGDARDGKSHSKPKGK